MPGVLHGCGTNCAGLDLVATWYAIGVCRGDVVPVGCSHKGYESYPLLSGLAHEWLVDQVRGLRRQFRLRSVLIGPNDINCNLPVW